MGEVSKAEGITWKSVNKYSRIGPSNPRQKLAIMAHCDEPNIDISMPTKWVTGSPARYPGMDGYHLMDLAQAATNDWKKW